VARTLSGSHPGEHDSWPPERFCGTIRYVIPAGFVIIVWIVASSYALTAALSFARRDVAAGVWMLAWAILLATVGATAVRFLVYG